MDTADDQNAADEYRSEVSWYIARKYTPIFYRHERVSCTFANVSEVRRLNIYGAAGCVTTSGGGSTVTGRKSSIASSTSNHTQSVLESHA